MKPDVEQDERRPPLVDGVQRGLAVAGGTAFVAFVAEHARDEVANVLFIIDDQNIERHQASTM